MSGGCASCGNPIGWFGRMRGDALCGACAAGQMSGARAMLTAAAEPVWGAYAPIPPVSDRELRRFLQKVARATPAAAAAVGPGEQRAVIRGVWPDLMECAAHMTDSASPECEAFTHAADGIYTAGLLLPQLLPEQRGTYLTFWRLWWTAARMAGGVMAEDIADEVLPEDEARLGLAALRELGYAEYFESGAPGTAQMRPGYMPFIDCPGCQLWRATELFGLELEP